MALDSCDLHTTVLGTQLALPFLLGPIGSTRMFYPRGESAAAKAAGEAGTAYTLSTLSGSTIEDVRAASRGPLWYQLYLVGGHEVAKKAIARARAAGFTALVVTIDTPVAGNRERDIRDGTPALLTKRPLKVLPFAAQFVTRPRWVLDFLSDGGLMSFPNVIVVSNHGGRQLDGVAPTLRVLPEVVQAVKGQTEILMDGGIRRGSDIVKALCLGADAVLIGRAYAYGVAAGGGPGVARAIEILRTELVRTLKLLGCPSVADLDRSFVDVPASWSVAVR